jgi:hypothetical protein
VLSEKENEKKNQLMRLPTGPCSWKKNEASFGEEGKKEMRNVKSNILTLRGDKQSSKGRCIWKRKSISLTQKSWL